MTARQVWEGMLTELSKANAPSLLLHEFNYYFNKAINQYINKRYNIYDVNQQTTDDLRVLKATAIITPKKTNDDNNDVYKAYSNYGAGMSRLFGATYEVVLPDDYLHMLNCVCIYHMTKAHKCYNENDYVQFSAKRLTADTWSTIINDYYNRPLPERPYYYIHNVNDVEGDLTPTNTATDLTKPFSMNSTSEIEYYKSDGTQVYVKNGKVYLNAECTTNVEVEIDELTIKSVTKPGTNDYSNLPRTIQLNEKFNNGTIGTADAVEKPAGQRFGNASKVRCEIRYGRDDSIYKLDKVFIDYIKAPQVIRLTQEQVDLTEDKSQIMEFPDYVCQEIINELVLLVMARDADPRLQIQPQVSQSIANPAQP